MKDEITSALLYLVFGWINIRPWYRFSVDEEIVADLEERIEDNVWQYERNLILTICKNFDSLLAVRSNWNQYYNMHDVFLRLLPGIYISLLAT